MGEILSGINTLNEKEILAVINPPMSERKRDVFVSQGQTALPSQAAWRMGLPIGKQIPTGISLSFDFFKFLN